MNNFQKYFHISASDEVWGFNITTAGFTKVLPQSSYPVLASHPADHLFTWSKGRVLNAYYMVLIAQGQGVFETALSQPQTIEAGSVFFLYPGVWHRYKPNLITGWEEYWVGLKGEYADALFKRIFTGKQTPVIKTGFNRDILKLFKKTIDILKVPEKSSYRLAAAAVFELLNQVHILQLHHHQNTGNLENKMEKAKYLMMEYLQEPVQMTEVARKVNMGYSLFRKSFKQHTGLSPNNYLLTLRLEKAKELLVSTPLSVEQIAIESGFGSVQYLSKLFTIKMKQTPTKYRSENKM